MAPPPSAGSARVRRDSTLSGDEDVFEDGKSSKPTTPKEKEAPAKLVPAPPPKENVWQRRKEEQQQVSILFPPQLCCCFNTRGGSKSKILYSCVRHTVHFNWPHSGIVLKEKIGPTIGHIQNYMLIGFATAHIQALITFTAKVNVLARGTVALSNAVFKQNHIQTHFKRYEKP